MLTVKRLFGICSGLVVMMLAASCADSPTQITENRGAPGLAGNAHFVGTPQLSTSGNTATASGKIAGLGNISQIHVEVTGDAACVNRGNRNPEAENKDTFSAEGDFPVQNGKANFSLVLTATFQPSCSPPMRVEFSNLTIIVTDASGNVLLTYP